VSDVFGVGEGFGDDDVGVDEGGVEEEVVFVGVMGVGVGSLDGVVDGVVGAVVVGSLGVGELGVVRGVVGVVEGVIEVRRAASLTSLPFVGAVVGGVDDVPVLVLGWGPTSTVGGRLFPVLCSTTPVVTAPARTSTAIAATISGLRNFGEFWD
jgi:hypothetical protein